MGAVIPAKSLRFEAQIIKKVIFGQDHVAPDPHLRWESSQLSPRAFQKYHTRLAERI